MSNKNLSKTLFADFRKIDTKKLNINGNPFSKVVTDHVPETPTANDIWKYAVTTDENGVVTVTDDVAVDYSEITTAQKNITKTAAKVIDNKILDANGAVLMNWDTKNFTNTNGGDMRSIFGGTDSQKAPISEWDSDLSSLEKGYYMFRNTTLASFNGDLSKLTHGYQMFYESDLASFSGDLTSLTDGMSMFSYTALASFNGDLSSLNIGHCMFRNSALTSFNGDLSKLTNGSGMFRNSALTSFRGNLSSLTNSSNMFYYTALTSFRGDLPKLTNGYCMFHTTALTSFNGDLSSLTNSDRMFCNTHTRTYTISHYKMVDGVKQEVETSIMATGLKSFISNLSSLKGGYYMFGYSSTCSPLDEDSIMLIADTINDISTLDKSDDNDWTYTYYNDSLQITTSAIPPEQRGVLHLGYDKSITDKTNIFKYCDEIVAKGWTVYLNGSQYVSTNSGSAALIDGESSTTPIPHYYKPVQVTDENVAEYVDQNGNFFIIIGAQHVFGDDISTYGMFTSYEHAVTEITSALGLSVYVKPTEE